MNKKNASTALGWLWILGICGVLVLIGVLSGSITRLLPVASMATGTQATTLMASSTVGVTTSTVSPIDVIAYQNTAQALIDATITAAAKTPWWLADTPFPPPTEGPTDTPDFSMFRHQTAGNGTILWSTLVGVKDYPMTVYNQWYDNSGGIRVFAGVTDPNQGAIGVLTSYTPFDHPEIYPTPRQSGNMEIIDAQGERLEVRSTTNGDIFYFDLPTRSFVESFTATPIAPTVTPIPSFTPFPTIQYPPIMPSTPTPGGAYPPPITPAPNPTASALPPQETGTSQP